MKTAFKAGLIFEALGIRDESQNSIQSYLCDLFADSEYDSVRSLVRDLEQAHWAAGSFGLIYTQDLEQALSNPHWREAIDSVLEQWEDCTGEPFKVQRLTDALVLALDWESDQLSNLVDSVRYWLVSEYVASLDTSPEKRIFQTEGEASEYISEAISGRVDYLVQHSPYSLSEADVDALIEQESELFRLEEV